MTEDLFKLGWATLLQAFPNSSMAITSESQMIYWEQLKAVPDDLWKKGVQRCLRTCRFFPVILELGEACLDGHLVEPFRYNPHCYNEPKVLEWRDALQRVLIARSRPPEIAVEPAEILPPPTRREAREILHRLKESSKKTPPRRRRRPFWRVKRN
jgi:hypothetical protein